MTRRRKVQRGRLAGGSTSRAKSSNRSKSVGSKLQLYVDDAATEMQPRVTDMIPRRKYGLFIMLASGLILVASVQALYVSRVALFPEYAVNLSPMLELVGPGTLATWLSTMLLAFSACVAMTIFSVRRHKLDDYRGTYGVWLYVALFCGLASLDVSTGLHKTFQSGMIHLTHRALWGDGSLWWVGCGGAIAAILSMRVIIDAWRSRGAVFFLLLAAASYATAALMYLHVWQIGPLQVDTMATVALTMLGHVLMAFSMMVYARFVYREATGELKKKARKKKKQAKEKSEKAAKTGGRWFFSGRNGEPQLDNSRGKKQVESEVPEGDEYDVEYEEVADLDELERLTDPDRSGKSGKSRKKQRRQSRRAA